MPSAWTPDHVAGIISPPPGEVPPLDCPVPPSGGEGRYYWDMWPVQRPDGTIAHLGGREMWMVLTAPDRGDPGLRHFEAKIHWLERTGEDGDKWIDRGPVLPEWVAPYEREWAGSALLDGDRLTLFFTGAGTAERPGGYQQRLFEASAPVAGNGTVGEWTQPVPSIAILTPEYCAADAHEGEPGRIKAFRDPAFFRDPADGSDYLVFTASLAGTASDYNGAIGLARRDGNGWALLAPLLHADGVNNELERAHVVFRDGHYYAFWVTQRATFAPEVPAGPTGLYGMVADALAGPWHPVNGSGLVLANPVDDPQRCYSWFVSAEGITASFVDDPAGHGFAGVPAPLLTLDLRGDCVTFAHRAAAA